MAAPAETDQTHPGTNSSGGSSNNNNSHKSLRYVYDQSCQDPKMSPHWQSLSHDTEKDHVVETMEELISLFRQDVAQHAGVSVLVDDDNDDDEKKGNNNKRSSSHSCSSYSSSSLVVALWSIVAGYCEALTTHKEPTSRYSIFPIPMDALRRLVHQEFVPFLESIEILEGTDISNNSTKTPNLSSKTSKASSSSSQIKQKKINTAAAAAAVIPRSNDTHHRRVVRRVANAIWKQAQSKSANVRDELHANSLYVCLRGKIDKKSLDCFGAATITILACQYLNYASCLTLSEDHAYESHKIQVSTPATTAIDRTTTIQCDYDTCEVAIPGMTKQACQKRGCSITETIKQDIPNLTPETSWLYMRRNPVLCDTCPMMLAAIIGNINCTIGSSNSTLKAAGSTAMTTTAVSASLYKFKRDLLWCLYDGQHLVKFPFALIELGDCEDHCTSPRAMEFVPSPQLEGTSSKCKSTASTTNNNDKNKLQDALPPPPPPPPPQVLQLEQLFLEAIESSQIFYNDAQAYPYFYAGHYHKDAGMDLGPDQEYRLVEALRLYAQAARVASQYMYDSKDSLYLMKHMTIAASLIYMDILTTTTTTMMGTATTEGCSKKTTTATTNNKKKPTRPIPRLWVHRDNGIAAGTWVLGFFDALFHWEEKCGRQKSFCEICTPEHKFSLGPCFKRLMNRCDVTL